MQYIMTLKLTLFNISGQRTMTKKMSLRNKALKINSCYQILELSIKQNIHTLHCHMSGVQLEFLHFIQIKQRFIFKLLSMPQKIHCSLK